MDPTMNPSPSPISSPNGTSPNPASPPMSPATTPLPPPSHSVSPVLAIILAAVALMILIIGGVWAFLYANDVPKRTSNQFMKYVTAGDADKAIGLTAATTDEQRAGIRAAVRADQGTSKLVDKAKQDDKSYFLYDLTGADHKHARTTIQKVGGTWKVVAYVSSVSELQLIPGNSTSTSTSPSTTTPSTTQQTACLAAQDFDSINKQINGPSARLGGLDFTKSNNPYYNNVHFKADSLEFADPVSLQQGILSAFGAFGKQFSAKTYAIHLKGSVGTTKQSDLEFANQRAQKMKDALVAQGVPAAKIVIDAPGSVGDFSSGNNATDNQTARVVVIKIDATCSGATNTGGNR